MMRCRWTLVILVLFGMVLSMNSNLLSQSVIGQTLRTPHKGLLLESSYGKSGCCDYTVTNSVSITTRKLRDVQVRWLSAALTTGALFQIEAPEKTLKLSYPLRLLLGIAPQPYDAADLWSIKSSVVATREKFPPEEFNAPAYASFERILKEVVNDLKKLPLKEILKWASSIGIDDKQVIFESTIERMSAERDQFRYQYTVWNQTRTTIYVKWLSIFDGGKYPVESSIAPGQSFQLGPVTAGGSPLAVYDIALLSTTAKFPTMEYLGSTGTFEDRILGGTDDSNLTIGLRQLPPEYTVLMVPAVIPESWRSS